VKAIVCTEYGSPDVLQLKEVPKPTPDDDKVLVKIHAASVNAADLETLRGVFIVRMAAPFRPMYKILGSDIAGRVEPVGRNVTQFQPGDEVWGDLSFPHGLGAFAEYVCAAENALHYMLDGAHNPAGVQALCEALENDFEYDRLILVWAAMTDKDFRVVLPQIARLADIIVFTRLEYERSALPEQMVKMLPADIQNRAQCENSLSKALAQAAEVATRDDLICIAGSLYLIGEARKLLRGELI